MGKKQQMKTVSGYHCGLLFDWGGMKNRPEMKANIAAPFTCTYSLQKYNIHVRRCLLLQYWLVTKKGDAPDSSLLLGLILPQ